MDLTGPVGVGAGKASSQKCGQLRSDKSRSIVRPGLEWGNNRTAGLLTQSDLLRGLQSEGANAPARSIMRPDVVVTSPDEPLHAAQLKMQVGRTRSLPVVDSEGGLLGLLTADDINEAYRLMTVSPELAASAG